MLVWCLSKWHDGSVCLLTVHIILPPRRAVVLFLARALKARVVFSLLKMKTPGTKILLLPPRRWSLETSVATPRLTREVTASHLGTIWYAGQAERLDCPAVFFFRFLFVSSGFAIRVSISRKLSSAVCPMLNDDHEHETFRAIEPHPGH